MATRAALRIIALSSAALALFTAGFALGQHPAPTDFRGVEESVLTAVDLAKEIDSVEDRELRVSRAIVAPGGHIGLHSHQGDPTIVYVLEGDRRWLAAPDETRARSRCGMAPVRRR